MAKIPQFQSIIRNYFQLSLRHDYMHGMEKPAILIIDKVHPYLEGTLNAAGYLCHTRLDITAGELVDCIAAYTGLVVRSRYKIDASVIDRAGNLKFIARPGSGMENIDTDHAYRKGIHCFNSPEGNRDAVGEHATGMIISLMNHIIRSDRQVRNAKWIREDNTGNEIMGKTIGIIGYGNTGGAFARCLSGFGVRVIAYDKYKKDFSDENVTEASMDEIFCETDILSLHVPLTPETRYLVDDAYLSCFKKSIYVINTSRGEVVRTSDLVKNLKSGKVKGAALDVLEYEAISFDHIDFKDYREDFQYLANADNVVMTSHIAGVTEESYYKLAKVLADKILMNFPIPEQQTYNH